jgi:hypothetical protein
MATTTSTTNSSLPGYIEPYVTDLFARSQALTGSAPAPAYTGARTAGLTPQQTATGASVSGLNAGNLMTQGASSIGTGANYTPSAGAFGLEAAQQYMNPYQQGVTDIAKREATRDDMIAQTGRDSAAAKAGAFGGSRHNHAASRGAHQHRIAQIMVVKILSDFLAVAFGINASAHLRLAFGAAIQRWRMHIMACRAQAFGNEAPNPAALISPVNQNNAGHAAPPCVVFLSFS